MCLNIVKCDAANASGVVVNCGRETCVDSDWAFTCDCEVGHELVIESIISTVQKLHSSISTSDKNAVVVAAYGPGTCVDEDGPFSCSCN